MKGERSATEEVFLALDSKDVTTQTPIKLRIIGDLIDLTQEHDTQDILRAVQEGAAGSSTRLWVASFSTTQFRQELPYINGTLQEERPPVAGATAIRTFAL